MPKVTYINFDGTEAVLDVPVGYSVMEGAVQNGINGVEAECGGQRSCATCHVYIDPAWLGALSPQSNEEKDMLELAVSPVEENSRLSCQIKVTEALDGLVVRLPEAQS
jgi:2Fe-2S ferredoxin